MSFEQIDTPSINYTGPLNRRDWVVAHMSTRARLVFTPYLHRYGEIRLELSRNTWPKEVRDRIEAESVKLSMVGRPPLASDFSVVLKSNEVLAIRRRVIVTIIFSRKSHREFDLCLRGTPRSFFTGTIKEGEARP